MDCPVCKYPNPAGATHCGMCQEVFNRSAAQAYLHAIRRERMMKEEKPPEREAVIISQRVVEEVKAKTVAINWPAVFREILSLLKKSSKIVAIGAALVAMWMTFSFVFSAGLWYHLLGKKLVQVYPEKAPAEYLVGMKSRVKSWSERQGHLDTPLERFQTEEIGTVMLEKKAEKKKATAKKSPPSVVMVRANEWVQVSHDAAAPISHSISKKDPSLAEARILLDKKGNVLERRFALSPRLAKSVPFLAPRFPAGRLRRGKHWTEEVAWLDAFNDWQIAWSGTLHWTLWDLVPCRESTCAKLTYTAELEPRLKGTPGWAQGAVHHAQAAASGEGEVYFDLAHQRLVTNTFSYDGLIRMPIDNLKHIPRELRIGRRVEGPGETAIRFENKIDVHKN